MKLSFVIGVITLISVVSVAFAEDGVAEETTVPSTPVQSEQQPDQYSPPAKSGAYNVDWEKLDSFLVSHPLAIVVVYSPSCPACHNYMPQFDAAVEQYKAELDPKADSGLEFVRVDGVDGSTDWTVDHGITAFPTVRLFANGAFVKKNLHENARTTPEILSMFQRMNTRMLSRTAPSVALEQDLDKIFNQVVMEERRTLILAQFASEEAPPGADPGETASPCRLAFAAGMAELVDLDYFTVHTTRIDGVSKAARAKIEVDIALKGFTGAHPDQGAVCSIYSLMTILRCSGANNTAPCKVLGASIPIPSSTDELVRAVLVHGVPEGVQLVPATSSLISRIWMDRSVPQTSRGLTQYTRVGRRTRPTLIYFSELKACEEDTPEFKWARYIKRTMRSIAVDYPNMTLMVADQYEFNTLYLRLGFNRQDSRDGIVMGIFDEGLRFSSVSLNFTKFKPEIIREFISAFNQGRIAPHITEVKYSKKTEGTKVTNQMSSLGFFNTLWRTNEPIPDPRPVGGIEDVILVVFAHKHCMRCREIIAQYELLIDARNRRLERVGKANQASSQFLTMTAKDRAEAAKKPGYVDLEEIVNGATVDANRKGLVLERLVPIFVNATDNYPPTEIWQPVLTSNLRPIIGTCVRVSQIAFDEARKPQWEVTAHAPGFMDFMSTRFAHSAPTALHLLDLAVSEWERHESFGLKVVRMEK